MSFGHATTSLGEGMWIALTPDRLNSADRQLVIWRHILMRARFMHDKAVTTSDVKKSLSNKGMAEEIQEWEDAMAKVLKMASTDEDKHAAQKLQIATALEILETLAYKANYGLNSFLFDDPHLHI